MIAQVRKALLAGVGAFVTGVVAAAIQKGGMPGWPEIGTAVGVGIAAGWTVYRVPNQVAVTGPAAK